MMQLHGFLVAARFAALNGLRGKRLAVLLLICVIPILAMLSVGQGSGAVDERAFHIIATMLILQFVVPFCALFLGTSVLGDELEGRTVTYLFTRPVDRGILYLGRLVGTGVSFSILLAVLIWVALRVRTMDADAQRVDPGQVQLLAVAGFWVYFALFAALRTLLKRALLVGMAYIMLLDLMVSKMPYIGIAKLSIWHHLMVIYTDGGKARADGLRVVVRSLHPDETASGAILFLVGMFVISAFLGAWFTRTREYHVAGAVA